MQLPTQPEFKPYDFVGMQSQAVQADKNAYAISDSEFKRRHKPILKAERLFKDSVLQDQMGDTELPPALQHEFMRSGLGSVLGSSGSLETISPGSGGEAAMARNLGLNIMGYQDRNRGNRNTSLAMAEGLFPRRTYGMSGADYVNVAMANTKGENDMAQAAFQNQVSQQQYNDQAAAGDAAADAQKKQAMVAGGAAIAGAVLIAL